jgi:hypothetical protein
MRFIYFVEMHNNVNIKSKPSFIVVSLGCEWSIQLQKDHHNTLLLLVHRWRHIISNDALYQNIIDIRTNVFETFNVRIVIKSISLWLQEEVVITHRAIQWMRYTRGWQYNTIHILSSVTNNVYPFNHDFFVCSFFWLYLESQHTRNQKWSLLKKRRNIVTVFLVSLYIFICQSFSIREK